MSSNKSKTIFHLIFRRCRLSLAFLFALGVLTPLTTAQHLPTDARTTVGPRVPFLSGTDFSLWSGKDDKLNSIPFVREVGARVMLRGLRTLSDMEYEFHMSLTNHSLDPEIETVFLMAQVEHSHFSSTLIRHIGLFGGDLDPFLPPEVQEAVRRRVRERREPG